MLMFRLAPLGFSDSELCSIFTATVVNARPELNLGCRVLCVVLFRNAGVSPGRPDSTGLQWGHVWTPFPGWARSLCSLEQESVRALL